MYWGFDCTPSRLRRLCQQLTRTPIVNGKRPLTRLASGRLPIVFLANQATRSSVTETCSSCSWCGPSIASMVGSLSRSRGTGRLLPLPRSRLLRESCVRRYMDSILWIIINLLVVLLPPSWLFVAPIVRLILSWVRPLLWLHLPCYRSAEICGSFRNNGLSLRQFRELLSQDPLRPCLAVLPVRRVLGPDEPHQQSAVDPPDRHVQNDLKDCELSLAPVDVCRRW